jgi:anti-sigma factor RsiW
MDRTMNHDEIAALLGAFALDAVDPDEAAAIRAHLTECPRCSAEVAEHWEVTGLIANVGVDAPSEIWDRIAARIDTGAEARRPAPLHLASSTSAPRTARRRLVWSGVGAIAAAVAVVAVPLGVQVSRLDQRVNALADASRHSGLSQALQAALLEPNAQKVSLVAGATTEGSASRSRAVVVVLPDGSAFLVNTGLPRLPSDRTYQLWGVVKGQTVSLGLLGSQPHDVAFTVDPSAPVQAFAVTDEAAGGVVRSVHTPVAESTSSA